MPVVMGSAGHIDHGKTSLVRALTGTDCDRLEEEKRRGITIELGFAYLPLPDGERLSIVDVPGHERFVKNMVAGAAGIDFVTLVIAADEGVMPQTREHLEICSLLGIRHGIVALSKVDMVDEEWLALVTEDVKSFLKGSFLEDAPIFPVSSVTGQGLDVLREALYKAAASFSPRRRTDLPRLPVDRVFTMRGHGTVVTGTLISGSFKLGEDAVLMPSGLSSKIRGLQSHGKPVELAPAGFRTAVNLPGFEVAEVKRGEVLTRPGALFASMNWMVRLKCLESSPRALRHRVEAHFHHGAREVQARLYFWDRDRLEPGQEALCQVRFTEPMSGVFMDRCVVRSFSPLRTVAGGFVLYPLELSLRRKSVDFARKLELLDSLAASAEDGSATPDLEVTIETALSMGGTAGATFAELCVLSNADSSQVEKTLKLMGSRQQAFVVDREERRYVGGEVMQALEASALDAFAEYHKKEPMKAGLGRGAFVSGWGARLGAKLSHFVLERLLRQNKLVSEGEVLRLPEHKVSMAGGAAGLRESLREIYGKAGYTPPNLKDVLETLKAGAKEAAPVIKVMQDAGELTKLTEDIYYDGAVFKEVWGKAQGWFDKHDNLDLAAMKELTGLSRKYLIALLEYFDKSRLTVRVGDKRILRK